MTRHVLHNEQDLHQRIRPPAARHFGVIHDLIEWHILMLKSRQAAFFGPFKPLREPCIGAPARAQRHHVDKKANQVFKPRMAATGHVGADHQVIRSAVPVQPGAKAGQQHRKRRSRLLPGETVNGGHHFIVDRYRHAGARAGCAYRPRTIRWQGRQHRRLIEISTPKVGIALRRGLQPTALPNRIVRVLNRQLRQRRHATGTQGLIKADEFFYKNRLRPAIEHHMVHTQQ